MIIKEDDRNILFDRYMITLLSKPIELCTKRSDVLLPGIKTVISKDIEENQDRMQIVVYNLTVLQMDGLPH